MDDESYFQLNDHNIAANRGFYCRDKSGVKVETKYKEVKKFPKQMLVWLAISSRGHSTPYVITKQTINQKNYSKECITRRLLPFLTKHHSDGHYVFWPDLASAHYGQDSIAAFNAGNVHYVKRLENPPNVPNLRPIELFWAHLKAKVYDKGWEAKDYDSLKSRIKRKLKEFSPSYFRNLMSKVKTAVRKAADNGLDSLFK